MGEARRKQVAETFPASAPPFSQADVHDILDGRILPFASRKRVAESLRQLMRSANWLQRKYQEQFERNTSADMRAAAAIARNQELEREIAQLRDLQGQDLGNAIFDSYARTWEELASRVTQLETLLAKHEPVPPPYFGYEPPTPIRRE